MQKNMEILQNMLRALVSLLSLAVLVFGQQLHSQPLRPNANFHFTNVTNSNRIMEVNPRFIQKGRRILYLEFVGKPFAPQPWDYRLVMVNQDGSDKIALETTGVIDYNVRPDDQSVLLLKSPTAVQFTSNDDLASSIFDWEIWNLSLLNGEKVLLESSSGLPLSEGYRILGRSEIPAGQLPEFRTTSPKNTFQMVLRRTQSDGSLRVTFTLIQSNGMEQEIFRTECWKSYSDLEWQPSVIWLDESHFITLGFVSNVQARFPQSEGLFSIVRIDLQNASQEILYSDAEIRPFPKFVLNPTATELYFQKANAEKGTAELWKLNLLLKGAELVYWVNGDLGEPRFSNDGRSFVFTRLMNNNFDILRADLDREYFLRVASE
ncbi:MAG: hypothetical protein ACE5HS_07825 [bacterium]